jgi:hypothetical protein
MPRETRPFGVAEHPGVTTWQPKSEARNPKEIESHKCRCSKPLVGVCELPFWVIGIRFGFRDSGFLPEQQQIAE